jgi:hypothetical protein
MTLEALNLDGVGLHRDNIVALRPVTQKVLMPLQGAALDEYARLMGALEDLKTEERDIEKKLALTRFRMEALWLRVNRINEARVK